MSPDARLGFAYEAALQCGVLALLAEGYAPAKERHHERAIESLSLTAGLSKDRVSALGALRRRRNTAMYEMAGMTTAAEAAEAVKLVLTLDKDVRGWLRKKHPDFL